MCTVNIRGHEANFYEAEARCHEAEIEAEARKSEAEAEAARPNDLASTPHGPGGLNIPGIPGTGLTFDSFRQSLKTHLFGDRSA